MPELEHALVPTEVEEPAKAERWFNRFTREQRYLHAVLFSTFLGLAGTGLPLLFCERIWARGLAGAVGGFGAILFFHKFCALVLTSGCAVFVFDPPSIGVIDRAIGYAVMTRKPSVIACGGY